MADIMSELKQILGDLRAKTGTEVRLAPRGSGETHFVIEFCGVKTDAWIDGGEAETERERKLIAYLITNAEGGKFPKRADFLKSVLLGEGGEWQAFRFLTKFSLTDGECYALDVVPDRRHAESVAHIERCLADTSDMVVGMDGVRLAVVKFSDDGQTPYEFGQFLSQTLYEELGVRASVGIGCEVKSFSEIAVSYHQAATAVRMSDIFHATGEVHTYREYLLVKMLEDIPKPRLKEYMEQFRISNAGEVFDDEEMAGTAEEFLASSLNISETSRNLFMHRNTLMYRLDKIERITGLNIREFSDAVTFRVITILYKLLQS